MANLDLDHVGVVVRDLDAGRAIFSRLGFALTLRSMHSGATYPGGPIEPWASGNHCAMLGQGYLEVLGEVPNDGFSSVRHLLDRYEGIHMVVFSSPSPAAEVYQELLGRGVEAGAPRYLERPAAFGSTMQEKRLARFNNVYLEPAAFPHATVIFIEHLTRDVLWQPHLLHHPNGVTGLAELGFVSRDPCATAQQLSHLLGVDACVTGGGCEAEAEIALANTRLCVTNSKRWALRFPNHVMQWPAPAWMGLHVRSIDETADFLREAGVEICRDATAIWVDAASAGGAALRFTERAQPTKR